MRWFYPSTTTWFDSISIKLTEVTANVLDIHSKKKSNTGSAKTINSLRILKQHQRSNYFKKRW